MFNVFYFNTLRNDLLTISWNELTFLWNEITFLWNDLTMERNDRKPMMKLFENKRKRPAFMIILLLAQLLSCFLD